MIQIPRPAGAGAAAAGNWVPALRRDADIAAAIGAAVITVAGVAALSAGDFGRVGTFARDLAVHGVRVDDEHVQVHIVARYGTSLPSTAAGIGDAVAPLLGGRSLQIAVQDILLPGEQLTESALDRSPIHGSR